METAQKITVVVAVVALSALATAFLLGAFDGPMNEWHFEQIHTVPNILLVNPSEPIVTVQADKPLLVSVELTFDKNKIEVEPGHSRNTWTLQPKVDSTSIFTVTTSFLGDSWPIRYRLIRAGKQIDVNQLDFIDVCGKSGKFICTHGVKFDDEPYDLKTQ